MKASHLKIMKFTGKKYKVAALIKKNHKNIF